MARIVIFDVVVLDQVGQHLEGFLPGVHVDFFDLKLIQVFVFIGQAFEGQLGGLRVDMVAGLLAGEDPMEHDAFPFQEGPAFLMANVVQLHYFTFQMISAGSSVAISLSTSSKVLGKLPRAANQS